MGSYCSLRLDGYEIDSSKSYINAFWACLFDESDKRSRMVNYADYYTEPLYETEEVPTTEYAATVDTMKLRLEILGYTLEKVKTRFTEGITATLENQQRYHEEHPGDFGARELKYLATLKNGGFDNWLKVLKTIFDGKVQTWSIENVRDRENDDLPTFLVDTISEDIFLGYPNIGMGYFLRGALEAVDPEGELILDITSLVYGGYYEENEAVCSGTAQGHIAGIREFQKIIILTEGTTDSRILSESLKILYPKVASYFSFMDFDTMKADGGSSALERTVKSFAAAGINNKIIALFDNDAAGVVSFKRLKKKPLPNNIRILTLPYLPVAKAYPTIGPQGMTKEDVNGRACSIEMYLGVDLLAQEDGYIPVHWQNLAEQIKVYQGEIDLKSQIQQRFFKKLKLAEGQPTALHGDWSGLQLIFETIFGEVSSI